MGAVEGVWMKRQRVPYGQMPVAAKVRQISVLYLRRPEWGTHVAMGWGRMGGG